ncbi:MAG: hypothetical protein WAM66_13110 [Acidobacteriaceae bacterium]
MTLFRVLVPLLLVGALPCVAQTLPPMAVGISGMEGSPCSVVGGPKSPAEATLLKKKLCSKLNEQKQGAIKIYVVGKNSACYSIRDYRFAARSGSGFPKLKGYSTCERASLFRMQEVTASKR